MLTIRDEPGMKSEEMERQRKIRATEEELAKRKIDVDEEVMRKVEGAKKHVEHHLEEEYERRTKEIAEQYKAKEAEERLTMLEKQREIEEEKRSIERDMKKNEKKAQEMILNKKNSRPKLTFGLKNIQPK